MIFTSSSNLTRVLMQYSIIMKVTMNSFHFSYSIFASQKLFHEHPGVTVLSCSTHMKHFLVFSAREPVLVMEFERLQNLEAVGEEVSILVFQISTVYVTHSLDKNIGKITNMVIKDQLVLMHIVPLSRLLHKKIFWELFGLLK